MTSKCQLGHSSFGNREGGLNLSLPNFLKEFVIIKGSPLGASE